MSSASPSDHGPCRASLPVLRVATIAGGIGTSVNADQGSSGIGRLSTAGREATLAQLLDAREKRAAKQKMLIGKYGLPLISFTVNMPGARKKTPLSGEIFREGSLALLQELERNGRLPLHGESAAPDTGYEGYFVVDAREEALKAMMLQIEEKHPLGRLLDLDVIALDGKPLSRDALGYPRRTCLLCDEDARLCARSGRHSLGELLRAIERMVKARL